jgi:hypothetical protein
MDTGQTSLTGMLLKDGALKPPLPRGQRSPHGLHQWGYNTGNLSPTQHNHVLGQCTDLNLLHWTLALASASPSRNPATHPREAPDTPREPNYTLSQPLPFLGETRTLPRIENTQSFPTITTADTPPIPMPWIPQFSPKEWVYTDGSDIKGQPRLGAAMVHIPTNTTIFIDAAGCEETHTIMRAEIVAIHTALARFEDHPWLGIFTDSLSSIQAIGLHYQIPGLSITPNFNHHMLLLQSIIDLLETRRDNVRLFQSPAENQSTHTYTGKRPRKCSGQA